MARLFRRRNFARSSKLSFGQVKQVQRQINKSKRLKNTYVPFQLSLTDLTNAVTPIQNQFFELSQVLKGDFSYTRSEEMIQLQSYNIKLGISHTSTATDTTPETTLLVVPWRIIIARSKRGPLSDITDIDEDPIVNFIQQPNPDYFQVYSDQIITTTGNYAYGTGFSNISPGYMMNFYKSFKKKKIPHMLIGYDDSDENPEEAIKNPIYMKIIVDPIAYTASPALINFQVTGWCHLKYFDKE